MAGRRGVAAGGAFLSQHHSTNEVDSAEEAAALDGAESDSLEEGFPRCCLLSTCYLKKPKLFFSLAELNKHQQRCMPKADRRGRSPEVFSSPSVGSSSRAAGLQPKRQSSRVTSVPLRVCLDYQTSGSLAQSSNRSSPSSFTASSSTHRASNASYSDDLSGGGSSTSSGRTDSPEDDTSVSIVAAASTSANGGGAALSWRSSSTSFTTSGSGRLQWSASRSPGDGGSGVVRGATGRRVRNVKAFQEARATVATATVASLVASPASTRRMTAASPASAHSRGRAGAATSEPSSSRRRASPATARSRNRASPHRAAVSHVRARGDHLTGGGSSRASRDGRSPLASVKSEAIAASSPPAAGAASRARHSVGVSSASAGRSSTGSRSGGGRAVMQDPSNADDAERDVSILPTTIPVSTTGWRDSLGSWGSSGAFTCPVNPLEAWDIPGCGKESRARDTKCDSCHRVIRVDWQVGAAASVGSGVENPQLKLAHPVTFQNHNGLTYMGKVVALDTRPTEDAPRGRVRVKYDDWPADIYDEDTDMELVTPKGWIPTPVGRAGRRLRKPVVVFTPTTQCQYLRKPTLPAPVEVIEVGEESGNPVIEVDGSGATSSVNREEGDGEQASQEEGGDNEDQEEETAEQVPKVKVWLCKHIRRGQAEAVNKLGQCKACYNAQRRTTAGITMCRHVREGEARACGRGPGTYGKGHCRECFVKKYPVKKIKAPRARLWPSCAASGCRRRHYAWGMCAPCCSAYKQKYPFAKLKQQGNRRSKRSWRYLHEDAEFTDSSDDDSTPPITTKRAVETEQKVKTTKGTAAGVKSEPVEAMDRTGASARAPHDAAFHGHASQGSEEVPSATRKQSILTGKRGESEKRDADDSKKREASQCVTRHAKRARTSALSSEDATCFYCQKSEGRNPGDELLLCADFDCYRSVHMQCANPALDKVPGRFYCELCVREGKDKVCEDPCLACDSNHRDDLILVCDRDKCYRYFHCCCLPQPLETPPEGEYVCPSCTGDDLERGFVIAKRSGGVRPSRHPPIKTAKAAMGQKERRCGACSKKCASQAMWKCGSGKRLCKDMIFHRKCLIRGKASPETWTLAGRQSGRRGSAPNGLVNGFGFGGGFIEMPGGVAGGWERGTGEEREGVGMEVKDSENYRLCCPECGFDLLKADMVDTLQKEKMYEGTSQQELAYKTFEKALRLSLQDPRFGIGQSREMFEEPFKGSIGSGAYRTAMYGSVFEAAVDEMFRQSKLTSEHKFLDIGCGIGSVVLQAAAWAGCQAAGVEIVEDRFAGAVTLHDAFTKAVSTESELAALMHPEVVRRNVHLFKGCFMEQWENPEVRDADFIFFNNSSGWFNNSKALNNPDEHSLEARLLSRLKNDSSNNGKILITLEHIAEWQPDCWERRTYKYNCDTRRAATYAANELEFWEYTVVSQWECPGCTSLNTDAVNDCIVCGTYCRGKRNSKRL